MIKFLISHCNDGDIIHAGAYFGDFLPALSRSCAPGAKIWAFEPNEEHYRCALITTYINRLRNVELTNAGLGERHGSQLIVTTDASGRALGGSSRILPRDIAVSSGAMEPGQVVIVEGADVSSGAKELVQVVAVDEMVPPDRKVSLIQLDVESSEQEALAGAMKTIHRCLPIIIVETVPKENWLSENILRLGYRMTQEVDGNAVFIRD